MNHNNYFTISTNTIDINESQMSDTSCSMLIHKYVKPAFYCIIVLLGALLSIYIIVILGGLLIVSVNIVFESTMVFIVGRASYHKNFPICSAETYSGNNCYTTRSTYCS